MKYGLILNTTKKYLQVIYEEVEKETFNSKFSIIYLAIWVQGVKTNHKLWSKEQVFLNMKLLKLKGFFEDSYSTSLLIQGLKKCSR